MAIGAEPLPERSAVVAALELLRALQRGGMDHLVLCPGSRSGPLAAAAGLLERHGLRLHPALDERSAAFFALGLGRALGRPAGVVTTSGSAVANLLPAVVEADTGTIPLLLLSADRPDRLKGCGANQSVNQETFLRASCRWFGQGDGRGLAAMDAAALERLAAVALAHCLGGWAGTDAWNDARSGVSSDRDRGGRQRPPGPVHLNLPFEEPLHASGLELLALERALQDRPDPWPAGDSSRQGSPGASAATVPRATAAAAAAVAAAPYPLPEPVRLDPDAPGVVVAGPWRGSPQAWPAHLDALRAWQRRSGWPVLADALSGLRGQEGLELVAGYDLILECPPPDLGAPQVLRLGSLPASRRLQRWLQSTAGTQVLVSEGDPRPLDPLGCLRGQWSGGLAAWWDGRDPAPAAPSAASLALAARWQRAEARVQALLDRPETAAAATASTTTASATTASATNAPVGTASATANATTNATATTVAVALAGGTDASTAQPPAGAGGAAAPFDEPGLARRLAELLPAGLPLMLANSSPVRDWESFSAGRQPPRPLFSFRGASGIDGTLSIAAGLAEALGRLVLISGDLALLHDANGWLWLPRLAGRLTVLVIANDGGGIFEQLPIRTEPAAALDFERLFAMPQTVDPLALAAVHGVPGRQVAGPAALEQDLAWALEHPCALLSLTTDRSADASRRRRLRTMAARACAQP